MIMGTREDMLTVGLRPEINKVLWFFVVAAMTTK